MVVEDGIYFISKANERGVLTFDSKTSLPVLIASSCRFKGSPSWGLTVSPDRRTFLYTLSDDSGSDLMLVENFR